MSYPVKPVVLPADLRRVANGKLSARLLRRISGGGYLHHRAAGAWEAMRNAAKADGVELGHVGAYRSYEQQLALFRDRYQSTPNGARVTRRWQGVTYYLKPGKAPSAAPGTSNHGWGLAIDVKSIGEGERLAWLRQHAGRFGFTWEVADPANPNFEAWHIRFVLGDADLPGTAPTAAPGSRDLRRGDEGADVARMQQALIDAGYAMTGGADGKFGPATEAALRAFQGDHNLTIDGICGARTRVVLDI